MLSKKEFKKRYSKLSDAEKSSVRKYYEDILKNAIFTETFTEAEKRLLWMEEE